MTFYSRESWLVCVVSLSTLSACGTSSSMSPRMRETTPVAISADPNNATVVFVNPADALNNGIVDVSGAVVGEVPNQSKLVTSVSPGPHTFIKVAYKNANGGNLALWGSMTCNQLSGIFRAGKIYFVELSVFRLFAAGPNSAHVREWAAGKPVALESAASVANDPEWPACVAQAAKNAAKEQSKNDRRSTIQDSDAFDAWP